MSSNDFEQHLACAAPNFVKGTVPESIAAIVEWVRKFLNENNLLPPKTEVLRLVDEVFDEHVGPMIKGKLMRAIANELLLAAVGEIYDAIAADA